MTFGYLRSEFKLRRCELCARLPALNAVHSFGYDGTSVWPGRCIKHSSISSTSSYNRLQGFCATLSECVASPISFDSGAVVGNSCAIVVAQERVVRHVEILSGAVSVTRRASEAHVMTWLEGNLRCFIPSKPHYIVQTKAQLRC